jgi:N-methylhydantoinase A
VTRTILLEAAEESLPSVNHAWAELAAQAEAWWEARGFDTAPELVAEVDVRYRGQHHELTLAGGRRPWGGEELREMRAAFYRLHELRYGYSIPTEPVQIVNVRLVAQSPADAATLAVLHGAAARRDAPVAARTRPVYWESAGTFVETEVVARGALGEGVRVTGPLIVEQADTTIAVPPGHAATTDATGNLRIRPL